MRRRNIIKRLRESLDDTPVVLLNGARQTGKSTLVKEFSERQGQPFRYVTLDDAAILSAAQADPDGFLSGLASPVVIDEVQRVPDLFRAIKLRVDRDRKPGLYLLTGSADVLLLPGLSESLAGRKEIITLWPFSQGEIEDREDTFVDTLFEDRLPDAAGTAESLWRRVVIGGYPEATRRARVIGDIYSSRRATIRIPVFSRGL